MRVDKTRFIAGHQSLKTLIIWAYKVKEDQVIGPEWLNTVYVDIEAKLPKAPEHRKLACGASPLADRFKMAVRRENRERPIYALVVGKGGLKMKGQESSAEPETPPTPESTVGLPGSELRLSQTRNGSTLFPRKKKRSQKRWDPAGVPGGRGDKTNEGSRPHIKKGGARGRAPRPGGPDIYPKEKRKRI